MEGRLLLREESRNNLKVIMVLLRIFARLQAFFFLPLSIASVSGAVVLPPVLASHMVLQRDMPVPIWGTADPNETISVSFGAQKKAVTADAEGKWMVKLDPLQASADPAEMTISGSNSITLSDILVGEVWLGSGQSNIDSPVNMYIKEDSILAEARSKTYPQLRLYRSARTKGWSVADNPNVIGGFSAQLFYYGVLLQKELNVPVGLIEAAFAGSPSAPFLPQEAFKSDPDLQAKAAKWDAENPLEKRQKEYEKELEKWKASVDAAMAAPPAPTDPAATSLAPAELTPGDRTASDPSAIPPAILAKFPKPKAPGLQADAKTGDRFETYVRPLIPFAIRGVLWDQGEGGPGFSKVPIGQVDVMSALIPSWRGLWGQGDFPWLYVQKPSGGGCALNPEDPINKGAKPFEPLPKEIPGGNYHSGLRSEAYGVIARNPNTFMVITSDLAMGVHPANKSGYAARDLRVALGAVYGRPIEYYGPKYESFKVEGDKIRIFYTHVGKGLVVPPGQTLQGFIIAGSDKKFYWADAVIDGQTVVVSSPKVPNPEAVSYAMAWPLAWANLFNADGLPAIGFRTK